MTEAFTYSHGVLLVRIILFHFFTDFVLQPDSWVKHRNEHHYRSPKLYLHGFFAAAGAYIAFWNWAAYPLFLVVLVTHILLDLWKSYQSKSSLGSFVTDQTAHIGILVACWLYWISGFQRSLQIIGSVFNNYELMLFAAGYVFCIFPAAYVVSFGTERWRKQIGSDGIDSLSDVGKWIGIIERVLVITIVFTGHYENIGLILAAKSIIRFSDAGVRKNTEYVLIGTMISFTLAVIAGLLIKHLMQIF